MKLFKPLFIFLLFNSNFAFSYDIFKVCEIVSDMASERYETLYQNNIKLFKNTNPNSQERKLGIKKNEEALENFLDNLMSQVFSYENYDSVDKTFFYSANEYTLRYMYSIALDDAIKNTEMPKIRIKRILLLECIKGGAKK